VSRNNERRKKEIMATVAIHLPPIDAERSVDVEVSINGRKRRYSYRVEVFRWEDWCRPKEERATGLKRMITNYDPSWQLMEIGAPTAVDVPLMFRRVG
jgi:predicted transcriptional regulator